LSASDGRGVCRGRSLILITTEAEAIAMNVSVRTAGPGGDAPQQAARTTTGLEPYQGPWNRRTAGHLLRRTIIGPSEDEVAAAASTSLDSILGELLQELAAPPPPIDPTTGQTWIGKVFDSTLDSKYQGYLKAWWLGLMEAQEISILEKLCLFWHNHFVSGQEKVKSPVLMYRQNVLLRRHALGNFGKLLHEIARDPAITGVLRRQPGAFGQRTGDCGQA